MTRRTRPSRRGILLLEVLFALSLIALFVLVFLPLWHAAWRTQKDASAAVESIFRAEAAAAQLRGDAWSAASATVAADGSLELGPEPAVRWSAATDAAADSEHAEVLLTRAADGEARTFRVSLPPTDDPPPGFVVGPAAVTLSLAGRRLSCPAPLLGATP